MTRADGRVLFVKQAPSLRRELEPLPVERVEELLTWNRQRLDDIAAALQRRSGPTLPVVFEDVHLASPDIQRHWLDDLWTFLDLDPIDHEKVAFYLTPSAVQMAGPNTYGRLPNAREINAALGSDETGRLTFLSS